MFHIYGNPASRSFRIYWLLEELNLKYTYDPISVKDAALPDFLKINPNAKIPALRDGDFYLFESAAIAYYICEHSQRNSILPFNGTRERAETDQWMFWILSELEQPIWWNTKNMHIWEDGKRVPNFTEQALYEFSKHKKIVSTHLSRRDYMVGGSFSVVDIYCAHTLNWAKSSHFLTESDSTLLKYIESMKSRPAFLKAKNLLKKT
ncbi:MAG: glutathione S-transferase family protein [Bdellovibrionales bacterium]|nr:glutathione S-transferase family protein [Bdellovibrionales bacterium]